MTNPSITLQAKDSDAADQWVTILLILLFLLLAAACFIVAFTSRYMYTAGGAGMVFFGLACAASSD